MNSPLTGAKEARKELEKFHISLNHEDLVPAQAYHRNHNTYPLVSYVSLIVALFISRNYEVIPVFISRTIRELEKNSEQLVTENYRKIVYDYLCQMTYFLTNYTSVGNDIIKIGLISKSLLDAGSKKAPDIDKKIL